MRPTLLALALAPALVLAHPTAAQDAPGHGGAATAGNIVVEAAWVRGVPPGAPVAAGYLTVTNTGETPDRLIGGSAPFAGRVEIHTMEVEDGVMRMAELEGGLLIAPGATEVLRPGGSHLMFMDLVEAPAPGETVTVTLAFAGAGMVAVEMPVSPIGAQSFPAH